MIKIISVFHSFLRVTALFLFILLSTIEVQGRNKVFFVGNQTNDLYMLLQSNGIEIIHCNNLKDAIPYIGNNTPLIITADLYPSERVQISKEQYDIITKSGARMYIEYPSIVPGYQLSQNTYIGTLERGVISSDFFGKKLPPLSILGINDCHLIPINVNEPLITFAKVAGFNIAQFGLKDTKTWPLLFIEKNTMVSTTSLSGFTKGRFGPIDSWRTVWQEITRWLLKDKIFSINEISIDPSPSFSKEEILPLNSYSKSIEKGAQWLWNARLFIHPSWEQEIEKFQPKGGDPNLYFGPPINENMLVGEGSRGVMEGHGSRIYYDGTQMYRYFVRGDIQGETAYLLASAASLDKQKKEKYNANAEKLLDYLFYTSGFRGEERNDRNNPAYGLISWSNTHLGTFFNDDNARCILGVIGASALMDNQRWNRFIVENILANLRTCSRQGFQGNALDQADIVQNGWQYYNNRDFINLHPHFESWMWACYLWLYEKTGYAPLLEKAKSGISIMMDAYPGRWKSQNGIQQERARMLLPLAWLVRIEDTPEHRRWLDLIAKKLLESQDECGAIREELGDDESDKHKLLVTSNDAYGKNEAPLIEKNGDPVADMLYTCNFSLFALNEAAHATNNPVYHDAVSRLSNFLVRIQVTSKRHKDIDGAWFRAFDYERWDYWASNADNGWGAWCTLTGWIQSWIVTTLTNIERRDSFWSITSNMDMSQALKESIWMMQEQSITTNNVNKN